MCFRINSIGYTRLKSWSNNACSSYRLPQSYFKWHIVGRQQGIEKNVILELVIRRRCIWWTQNFKTKLKKIATTTVVMPFDPTRSNKVFSQKLLITIELENQLWKEKHPKQYLNIISVFLVFMVAQNLIYRKIYLKN